MAKLFVKAIKLPSDDLALTNKVFLSPEDFKKLKADSSDIGNYISVKGFIFTYEQHTGIKPGFVGFSSIQRRFAQLALNEPLELTAFNPKLESIYLLNLVLETDYLVKGKKGEEEYKVEDLSAVLIKELSNQFFTVGQKIVLEINSNNLEFTVKSTDTVNLTSLLNGEKVTPTKSEKGILHTNTSILFEKSPTSAIRIIGGERGMGTPLLKPDFDFARMGIGGLDEEFSQIFRRAFASRIFPPNVVSRLGIHHVKGILLYGPPGTGKTLMARQIGKMLNGKEPKIVNGPEILNKYVGQSEENIRNLFADAEKEYKQKGDASDLHIIIFDEIDAICKQRGSRNDGTGVQDTVVNQLLSKIDGVESLNNILVIGMTNRKDLIDEALLRPGRLEVHMEISLPDENGRIQILNIHTRKMRDNNMLSEDVNIKDLSKETKNFSGAEIEGLVKSATSWALQRQIDVKDGIKVKDASAIKVARVDFEMALKEVKPLFGVDVDEFENCVRNGIINYGPNIKKLLSTGETFVEQVRNSDRTPLVSVLFEGYSGAGKTSLAVRLASGSKYPYIKLISPETLVGYSETGKANKITKIFEDAYKSPLSCIVVDDIERLLDYVRIGPRFSNMILQTLLVLLKKEPPKGRRLLILATTSNKQILEEMEFMESFNVVLKVPQISTIQEFRGVLEELQIFNEEDLERASRSFTFPISIKKLIMIAEMAKQGDRSELVDRFSYFIQDSSLTSSTKSQG